MFCASSTARATASKALGSACQSAGDAAPPALAERVDVVVLVEVLVVMVEVLVVLVLVDVVEVVVCVTDTTETVGVEVTDTE